MAPYCVDVLKHWQKTGILNEIKTLHISPNRDKYFLNTYFANFIFFLLINISSDFLVLFKINYFNLLILLFNGHIPKEKEIAQIMWLASGIINKS